MRRIRFENVGTRTALEESWELVRHLEARRDRLDEQIARLAATSSYAPTVTNLSCLRGISTLTAFTLAVEVGERTRFSGASIGAFLGLTPAEHSSGGHDALAGSRRPATPTPDACSWSPPGTTSLSTRSARSFRNGGTPRPLRLVFARMRGNRRLHHRWVRFDQRGKKQTVATTAIARELAGWCWSLTTLDA